MKVYLIYDRYEGDEWFDVYHVCKTKKEFDGLYRQDLVKFIEGGPDDCHSFQGQVVNVTEEEYDLLKKVENGELTDGSEELEEVNDLLSQFLDDLDVDSPKCLFQTDGCTDVSEMFENYMNEEHPDVDEDSPEWFEFQSDFFDDEKLFKSELVKYIDNNY